MKRIVMSVAGSIALFFIITLITNSPVRGDSNRDRNRRDREDEGELEVQIGFSIVPPNIQLNLQGKDFDLVGLGSYIVNAQGGCNDCHSCPTYKPGHNPFPLPPGMIGTPGDGQLNDVGYLAGGVPFGPVLKSANITPDENGRPAGLTLEQFQIAIRTGHDPIDGDLLNVMPWPQFRHMTGRDLDAIYAYLSAIPSATPSASPGCTGAGQ
jgi:hypothetical protein